MAARIKFEGRETEITSETFVFGRAEESHFSLPENPNISRRHAQITLQSGEYFIADLGSSNGTTINGQPISDEVKLMPGDMITLGNSVIVEFVADETSETSDSTSHGQQAPAQKSSKLPLVLGITGAACGLAIVFVAAAVAVPYMMSSSCGATAVFESPENGDTVTEETDIEVRVEGGACVERVVLTLNGKEVASMSKEPYSTKIDGGQFADLSDGGLYPLGIVLIDSKGNKTAQPGSISLAFETRKTENETTTPSTEAGPENGAKVSVSDVQSMTEALIKKSAASGVRYKLGGGSLYSEVQRYTNEYATAGFYARASAYRDVINQSFVREKSLDPALAYIVAFSRSRFSPAKQSGGEGLWQMTTEFASANAYSVACGTETLSDPSQKCASKAAALYIEDLSVKVFEGDLIYTVAAFGMTSQQANAWKQKLPKDRSDFWSVISDPKQRELIARFIAAGIVAENPQKFGLGGDRPISELYPPIQR